MTIQQRHSLVGSYAFLVNPYILDTATFFCIVLYHYTYDLSIIPRIRENDSYSYQFVSITCNGLSIFTCRVDDIIGYFA